MHKLNIQQAVTGDLPAIVAIYNSTIASRMVTADTEPVTVESRMPWFNEHTATRPLWVVRNETGKITGWISFGDFYGRPAYNATAEISIYVHEEERGKGLGKQLLLHCIATAPSLHINTLLGYVFSHNTPSLELFHRCGFETWGTLPGIALLDDTERTLLIVGKRIA